MDTSLNNIIESVFNTITLIDIAGDKVTFLNGRDNLKEVASSTYQEYYDKIKKVIHPDYINEYFNIISLNNLQNVSEYVTYKYSKLSVNLNYEMYTDIIKLVDQDKVLILTIKTPEKKLVQSDSDNMVNTFTDFIINIEQMINNIKTDDYATESAVKYINNLIYDIKVKDNRVQKSYSEKVTSEVSKMYNTLLIVDDDSLTRNIFKKVFEKDYHIIEATNGSEAVEILENNIVKSNLNPENIVGMFLDLKMPVMDGFGVLDFMNDKHIISKLPIVIISADDAKETKEQVYAYDIADMIEKPFNFEIIKKRVNNMISMYAKSNILKDMVNNQDKELKQILGKYVNTYLDNYASINDIISKYLTILVNKYNEKDSKINLNNLLRAVKYYDLGTSLIPSSYYKNLNNINDIQKKEIINNPILSSNIIKYIDLNENSEVVNMMKNIIISHNERYDGLGFPYGLKDKQISDYIYLTNIAIELASGKKSNKSLDETVSNINTKSNKKYSAEILSILNSSIDDLRSVK